MLSPTMVSKLIKDQMCSNTFNMTLLLGASFIASAYGAQRGRKPILKENGELYGSPFHVNGDKYTYIFGADKILDMWDMQGDNRKKLNQKWLRCKLDGDDDNRSIVEMAVYDGKNSNYLGHQYATFNAGECENADNYEIVNLKPKKAKLSEIQAQLDDTEQYINDEMWNLNQQLLKEFLEYDQAADQTLRPTFGGYIKNGKCQWNAEHGVFKCGDWVKTGIPGQVLEFEDNLYSHNKALGDSWGKKNEKGNYFGYRCWDITESDRAPTDKSDIFKSHGINIAELSELQTPHTMDDYTNYTTERQRLLKHIANQVYKNYNAEMTKMNAEFNKEIDASKMEQEWISMETNDEENEELSPYKKRFATFNLLDFNLMISGSFDLFAATSDKGFITENPLYKKCAKYLKALKKSNSDTGKKMMKVAPVFNMMNDCLWRYYATTAAANPIHDAIIKKFWAEQDPQEMGRRTLRLIAQAIEHAPEIICFQEADCYNIEGNRNLKKAFKALGYATKFHRKSDSNGTSGNISGIFIAYDENRYEPMNGCNKSISKRDITQEKFWEEEAAEADTHEKHAFGYTFLGTNKKTDECINSQVFMEVYLRDRITKEEICVMNAHMSSGGGELWQTELFKQRRKEVEDLGFTVVTGMDSNANYNDEKDGKNTRLMLEDSYKSGVEQIRLANNDVADATAVQMRVGNQHSDQPQKNNSDKLVKAEDLVMYNDTTARVIKAIAFTEDIRKQINSKEKDSLSLPNHRANGASDHVCVVVELDTKRGARKQKKRIVDGTQCTFRGKLSKKRNLLKGLIKGGVVGTVVGTATAFAATALTGGIAGAVVGAGYLGNYFWNKNRSAANEYLVTITREENEEFTCELSRQGSYRFWDSKNESAVLKKIKKVSANKLAFSFKGSGFKVADRYLHLPKNEESERLLNDHDLADLVSFLKKYESLADSDVMGVIGGFAQSEFRRRLIAQPMERLMALINTRY